VNGQSISSCANMVITNSKASCTVPFSTMGAVTIVASYLGSANYAPSTSGPLEETIRLGLNRWSPQTFLWW
jgi:hypothetical protein